ncbi:hypothetical protein EJB05_20987, partial [Eragrostis curvula]
MEEHHDLGAVPGGGEEAKGEQKMMLGEALGSGVGAEETPANSNACCICHEPWASCGAHRICCIPCGHVYGRSCLEMWLVRSGCAAAKCLWCEKQFKHEDIVNLYGTTEHIWDNHHHDQAASQVASEDEKGTWQVGKAAMEALAAETTRERAEIVREREEIARERRKIAWEGVYSAQKDVEIARRNLETARRNSEAEKAQVKEAEFIFIIFVILLALI